MVRSRRVRAAAGVVALGVLLAACTAKPYDYTGDRKADFVYASGTDWYRYGGATPVFSGLVNDVPVPGDYAGSGRWTPAVLRGRDWTSPDLPAPIHYDPPGLPSGPVAFPTWVNTTFQLGPLSSGALPVPADYDGTGKTTPAYYSMVDGSWWVMGHADPVHFGIAPRADGELGWDLPVPADYDGDGKADIAVFRPTDSTFHVLPSAGGSELVLSAGTTIHPSLPAPADYDGDGRTDAAVSTMDGTQWYRSGSAAPFATFPLDTTTFGLPAPADYDGDGRADAALVRPNNGVPPASAGWGTLEIVGQGTLVTPVGPSYFGSTNSVAVTVNAVPLVFYDHCRNFEYWSTLYPGHCPGP